MRTSRPPPRPSLRIGVVTDDPTLVEDLGNLGVPGVVVVVARDQASAHDILASEDYTLRVVQRSAHRFLPLPGCAECPLLSAMAAPDDLLLFPRDGCPTRVYRRGEIDVLREDVRHTLREVTSVCSILGDAAAIKRVREQVRRVARYANVAVLVLGETGTGKELVAEEIHRAGSAEGSPFVAINCAAIPEQLFESELFGHEAGAFTGARGARQGLLEAAGKGVLFLDEIGEMPQALQPKLLRALETRAFRRVGANRDIELRARIVSATNRLLAGESSLRADLVYRLAGFTISLPPLRERREDVPTLARSFLRSFATRHRIGRMAFDEEAMDLLCRQPWPGNVRELRSLVERVAIVASGTLIRAMDVEAALANSPPRRGSSLAPVPSKAPSLLPTTEGHPGQESRQVGLREVERDLVLRAYMESKQNLSRAARQLSVPRSTLRDKLRRYGAI